MYPGPLNPDPAQARKPNSKIKIKQAKQAKQATLHPLLHASPCHAPPSAPAAACPRCTASPVDGAKGLAEKEREEMCLRCVDFVDQYGDIATLLHAHKMQQQRFLLPSSTTTDSRKRGANDSAAATSPYPAAKAQRTDGYGYAAVPPAPTHMQQQQYHVAQQAPAPPAYYPPAPAAPPAPYAYPGYGYSAYPGYGYSQGGYGY